MKKPQNFRGGPPKPEVHSAEANVVDLLSTNSVMFSGLDEVHEIHMTEMLYGQETDMLYDQENEVHMVSSLSEALATSALGPGELSADKCYVAAVDTACNRTCAGGQWIELMLSALKKAPDYVYNLVAESEVQDHFRFGNGGVLTSQRRVRLPVCLGKQIVLIWICSIPCNSLGCLIGKDVLETLGAMLDVVAKKLQLRYLSDEWLPLFRMKAGHSSLKLRWHGRQRGWQFSRHLKSHMGSCTT